MNVEIDSGPPFSFGDMEIRGLQRYEPSIVRNLSPIRRGDIYDEEALLRMLRLARIGCTEIFAAQDAAIS